MRGPALFIAPFVVAAASACAAAPPPPVSAAEARQLEGCWSLLVTRGTFTVTGQLSVRQGRDKAWYGTFTGERDSTPREIQGARYDGKGLSFHVQLDPPVERARFYLETKEDHLLGSATTDGGQFRVQASRCPAAAK